VAGVVQLDPDGNLSQLLEGRGGDDAGDAEQVVAEDAERLLAQVVVLLVEQVAVDEDFPPLDPSLLIRSIGS
jgi:hypothetical protein